jgi:DNA-binding response OmpR family regulator
MREMRRHRILVVEDDRALANMYRMSLSFAGFDVGMARDGISALESIDAEPPDLIVLDLALPRLHGAVILAEVAANPETARIPIIVVTGSDVTNATAQASAIFRKPCAPELLLTAIEQRLTH